MNDTENFRKLKHVQATLKQVKEFAASYAEFNTAMAKIVKMCEEGENPSGEIGGNRKG